MTDTDMLYMASLEKRNTDLEAKVAELEEKHHNECAQIAHYSDELRRVKELLKEAVEGFNILGIELDSNCDCRLSCEECPLHRAGINCRCWKHQDEALALIGEDTNVTASATDINVGGKMRVNYEGDGYDDDGNIIYDTAYCPKCGQEYEVYYDNHDNYCRNCGQALDWSMDGGADDENSN